QVTAVRIHQPMVLAPTRGDDDFRADRMTPKPLVDCCNAEPMTVLRSVIAIEPSGLTDVGDEQIYVAVVINIPVDHGARRSDCLTDGTRGMRGVQKFSFAIVPQQQI